MEVMSPLTYSTTQQEVQDITQVGEARRTAADITANLHFDDAAAGEVAIVVNELATNMVRHGGGGVLLFNAVWQQEDSYLDVVALDKGQGMVDVGRCLEDGYSTGGTAGQGLGAVRRQASVFDIVSVPGGGTAVLARMQKQRGSAVEANGLRAGVVNVAKTGEPVCGDSWAMHAENGVYSIMVADGLGHGISAADASRLAIRTFATEPNAMPAASLQAAHNSMRATRGAAVAICQVNTGNSQVTYCGVGNIAGSILASDMSSRSMVSQNGIVGHEAKRISEFSYPWSDGAVLIMHSDGLQSQWSLQKYPGILRRDPALIAAILYRDYNRGRDDSTVVVLKQ
jgi:anti-sigma regulatory factor (Ser/Thr protein kinase)